MRIKFLVICLFGFIAILSVTWMWVTLERYTLEMNNAWTEYSTKEVLKSEALSKIVNGFGYGGFIHHFKNYVIRQDSKYYELANKSLDKTYEGINDYLSLGITQKDAERINYFRLTVDVYSENLKAAHQLISDSIKPISVDNAVQVDDTAAINALNTLYKASQVRAKKIQSFSKTHIIEIKDIYKAGFLSIITLMVVLFLGIAYIVFKTAKRSEENKILLTLAPDAILVSDYTGYIMNINKKAMELFNIPTDRKSSLYIEDLLPESIRDAHRKYRDDFMGSERVIAMDDRGKHFYARKLSGEIIPVDISISAYEHGLHKKSIVIIRDLSDIQRLNEEIIKDALTEVFNRKGCEEEFHKAISRVRRYDTTLCLLMLDIDHFKEVNDLYGHAKGDSVLKSLSDLLVSNVRESDVVSRWGGEEFLIITPEVDLHEAEAFANKLRLTIEKYFLDKQPPITVSIGVAQLGKNDDQSTLLERADKAMYQSKNNGRNRVTAA